MLYERNEYMYNNYPKCPYPYWLFNQMCDPNNMYNFNPMYPYPYPYGYTDPSTPELPNKYIKLQDYGAEPFVFDIEAATKQNTNFRIALWTGSYFQITLMSIDPGDDIGLEVHPNLDQFLRIEQGQGLVKMGDRENELNFEEEVFDDFAVVVPAGKWHNIINTGSEPLKLYSIYAPPQHPYGTLQETKEDDHHHDTSYFSRNIR